MTRSQRPAGGSSRGGSPAAGRQPGLDLIRAVAIAWVMLYHAGLFGLAPDESLLVSFGWIGVDLFFVLSGFLIAGQLFAGFGGDTRPNYRRFFIRRAMRTLPAYLVVMVIYLAWPAAREWPDLQPAWQFLSFTQNLFIRLDQPKAFSHAWSLCVEEQFYLLLPAAIELLRRRACGRTVVAVMLALMAAGMILRGWLWLDQVARPAWDPAGEPDWRAYMHFIYYPTWCRLDDLVVGVGLAALRRWRPAAWQRLQAGGNAVAFAGLVVLVLATVLFGDQIGGFMAALAGYPMLAAGIGLVVVAAAAPDSWFGRTHIPGASGLAVISYSLYLSHKLAFGAVRTLVSHGGCPPWLAPWLALLLALLVGTALYLAVERPFLRLRDRLAPRTLGAAVPAGGHEIISVQAPLP